MTEQTSFLRFLKLQLAGIFIVMSLIVVCLLTYSHYIGLDDSTDYYIQYEAETLSEAYQPNDEIIEFDPQVKEYYFSAKALPDALLSFMPLPINTVHLIELNSHLVYILPYKTHKNAPVFYVLHYFDIDTQLSDFNRLAIISLVILLGFFIYLNYLGRRLASQFGTFTPWIKQLATHSTPLPLPKNVAFDELLAPLNLLNQIKQENADLLLQQQQAVEQKTLFLQFLAHELRTPIAIQQAALSRLAQLDDIEEEVWQTFCKVEMATEKMKQLSQRLLLLWQSTPLESCLVDVQASIKHSLTTLSQRESSLVIIYDQPMQLTNLNVNPELWQLLIDNILQNAAKYSLDGQVNIRLSDAQICFSNQIAAPIKPVQGAAKTESFGVGLFIIKQVCQQLAITLNISQSNHYYRVSLNFV
ncbi:hypothetical protein PULV_b0343 [Pseudoalteromonas ulvae UL12]|uniref:sensor histidine kinase n=1 Tax=Pseudoalteromonas ulvae TaxID=107327 RepID=UPI00186B700D|nr:HAMP domain-containing histidine kinase [Pseudoalteromonas ulvae]MBE0365706.1 hypothetical protein [Pseudoalteromonas ulvae UL12]